MATPPSFSLYEGEQQSLFDRHPMVYKYIPGDNTSKPLVVFVPGMSHNARISYGGHEGYRDKDFLSHWFNQRGYGFLGVSYPLEAEPPIMPATSPDFTISEWGKQTAAAMNEVITEHNLSHCVVILAWSMAGKVLHPVTVEAKRLGIKVGLFVSLAATPALPGLLPVVSKPQLDITPAGYAINPLSEPAFLRQLDEQAKMNQEDEQNSFIHIIDPVIYKRDYLGATPIGLAAFGFRYDAETDDFVKDNDWHFIDDAQAHDYKNLPPMAAIYPTSALDFRHAMTDKATWSFLMVQRIASILTQDGTAYAYQQSGDILATTLSLARFRFQELQRVVLNIPELMTAEILGNHFFFVGESGAKETVETIVGFLDSLITIEQDIEYELSNPEKRKISWDC